MTVSTHSRSQLSAYRWTLAIPLVVVICVVAIVFVSGRRDAVTILSVAVIGGVWVFLCWHFRNSVRFSLVSVLGVFAVTHWSEMLRMQISIEGTPIGLADGVLVSYFLIQGGAASLERNRRNSVLGLPEWLLLFALAAFGVILGFAFGNQTYFIIKHWRAVAYLVLVFLATYSLLRNKVQVEQAIEILFILGILAALTLWRWSVSAATGSLIFIHSSNLSVQSIIESMDITTVLYLSVYVLILCRLLLDSSLTRRKKLLWLSLLLFLVVTIVFSAVRSNWVATGLSTLYVLVVSKRLRPVPTLAIVLGVLIGVWGTTQVISNITGVDSDWIFADRIDVTKSGEGRIEDVRQVIIAVNEHNGWFFGNGLGAATKLLDVMPQYAGLEAEWTGVHNSYAWYYLNLGLAGLLCLLVMMGRIFRATFIGIQRSRGQDAAWMVVAANAIILALAILAIANNTFQGSPNSIASVGVVWAIALRVGQIWGAQPGRPKMERRQRVLGRRLESQPYASHMGRL